MTSVSVTLHESNLSVHADTLVLCWMCVYGKAMRHRKPDEWLITCACAKAGALCATASEAGRALPAMPTASPGRCHHLRQHSPRSLAPLSPEAADSRQKRNRPQQMGPLTLASPSKHCVLVTCHLLLFSGLTTLQGRAFQFWVRHKRERGEEKLTRPLFAPAQILWKSWHQE